jgi:hypothetical protein
MTGETGCEMDGDENEAGRYRQRAEEVRKIAAATKDKESRATLMQVAEDYDRMAETREAIAKSDKKRTA